MQWYKEFDDSYVIILFYMDDGLITHSIMKEINNLKATLY